MRNALVDMGQAPHTAVIGCADSRAPLETIFDAMPGDIFVLRNAGNTCTHAEGSMVGSLEFSTGKLGAQLILVLGHTKCGAIYGATNAYLEAKNSEVSSVNSALEGLLLDLAPVAEKALADMGSNSDLDRLWQRTLWWIFANSVPTIIADESQTSEAKFLLVSASLVLLVCFCFM